jgi:hypothetical protein
MPDQCDDAQINDDHLHNVPPALRHGIYAETLLPGEDVREYEELHRTLIAEFHPIGALENDIVGTMTRLIWRKQNLAEFRIQCSKANWNLSLMDSLVLEDRLDGLIDKCLKRLLFARGVKSISSAPASGSSPHLLTATKAA